MTSIEQKLLDKFRDISLNFSMKDNKIQNEFGNNICKFETHRTIQDYDSVLDLLKELKTKIPDLEERINNISTNNISIILGDRQSKDRNNLYIELMGRDNDGYDMKLTHDYVTTVYKDEYYFWQADYTTKDVHMTPIELSEFVLQMKDEIARGDDIRTRQLNLCEDSGFKPKGDLTNWNINKDNEVDPLPSEIGEGSHSDIVLLESVDDYHLHVYEIEGTRYAMINAMSFFVEDESPAIFGSLFMPCDDVDTYVDAFVSDFKSFRNICQNTKKEMTENLAIEPILEMTDLAYSNEGLTL